MRQWLYCRHIKKNYEYCVSTDLNEDLWMKFWLSMDNFMNAGLAVLEEATQRLETE